MAFLVAERSQEAEISYRRSRSLLRSIEKELPDDRCLVRVPGDSVLKES